MAVRLLLSFELLTYGSLQPSQHKAISVSLLPRNRHLRYVTIRIDVTKAVISTKINSIISDTALFRQHRSDPMPDFRGICFPRTWYLALAVDHPVYNHQKSISLGTGSRSITSWAVGQYETPRFGRICRCTAHYQAKWKRPTRGLSTKSPYRPYLRFRSTHAPPAKDQGRSSVGCEISCDQIQRCNIVFSFLFPASRRIMRYGICRPFRHVS